MIKTQYPTFHDWILNNIPKGSTMLEFGSGEGTKLFAENYKVTSIEHDIDYIGLYHKNYIYAPIVDGWYDVTKLEGLNKKFDVILIDGPNGHIGRRDLIKHSHLFDFNTTLVFDDINRPAEWLLFQHFLKGREWDVIQGIDRMFGIVY